MITFCSLPCIQSRVSAWKQQFCFSFLSNFTYLKTTRYFFKTLIFLLYNYNLIQSTKFGISYRIFKKNEHKRLSVGVSYWINSYAYLTWLRTRPFAPLSDQFNELLSLSQNYRRLKNISHISSKLLEAEQRLRSTIINNQIKNDRHRYFINSAA